MGKLKQFSDYSRKMLLLLLLSTGLLFCLETAMAFPKHFEILAVQCLSEISERHSVSLERSYHVK